MMGYSGKEIDLRSDAICPSGHISLRYSFRYCIGNYRHII